MMTAGNVLASERRARPKRRSSPVVYGLILATYLGSLCERAEGSTANDAATALSGHTWTCIKGGLTYGRSGKWRGCPCQDARLVINGNGTALESCGTDPHQPSKWSIGTSESGDNVLTIDDPGTHRPNSYQLQFFAHDRRVMRIVEIANGLTDQERYFDYIRMRDKP